VRDVQRVELLQAIGPEPAHRDRDRARRLEERPDGGRGGVVVDRRPAGDVQSRERRGLEDENVDQRDHEARVGTEVALGVRAQDLVAPARTAARVHAQ
jgi:hypothetical protein